MTDERAEATIRRVIAGDEGAIASVVASATDTDDPRLVAMAALLTSRTDWMARARSLARTTRDRQVVAIGTSHLEGKHDLAQMLARDHLADHPDSVIVAWIVSDVGRHG